MSISLGLDWDLCFKSCWDSTLTALVYYALLLLRIWHGLAGLMLPQKYVQMRKEIKEISKVQMKLSLYNP